MPSRTSLRSVAALCAAFVLVPAAARPQALSLAVVMPAARIGPPLVVVPDVRGQTLSGAAVRVANVGLVPRHAASSPGDLDTSPVRRQWPRAGQRVPEGTVVALELATPAAAPARASTTRGAAAMAEISTAWLARTSATASFEPGGGAGNASFAPLWWIAAAGCALLALALRMLPPRRAALALAPAPAPPVDAGPAAHPASGAARVSGGRGRVRPAVWIKRARGVPRLALASVDSVAATEQSEA